MSEEAFLHKWAGVVERVHLDDAMIDETPMVAAAPAASPATGV